jgi:transposase
MKALLLTRAVLHADETPVPMLKPGLGRTHRAYLWSYSSSEYDELQTVIYDFTEGRGGVHARDFLGSWSGKLVCDDYSGYKALFDRGVIEAGCGLYPVWWTLPLGHRGHLLEVYRTYISQC